MYLKNITLTNYRNYQAQSLDLNPGVNIFLGDNGQGKTNLLEAIYYLASGATFRGNKDSELIRWQAEYFRLEGQLQKNRLFDLAVYVDRQKNKQVTINGVKYKRTAELYGHLQAVLFAPDDLKIIKGGPAERRRYVDMSICQLDKKYAPLLHSYQKVLTQRNNLLKDIAWKKAGQDQLTVWDQQLAQYGSRIILTRLAFLKRLVPIARRLQERLTENRERFNITYHSALGAVGALALPELVQLFLDVLGQNRQQELARGATLWGPHRDDLVFYLNDRDLKTYGSQGQQRTAVLALKLAELETFYSHNGQYPLLLLDDVMSELDDWRRGFLLKIIGDNEIQTVITGANTELITDKIAQNAVFLVREGKIINR